MGCFLQFFAFWASFPFILAFWAFISFHFGLLGLYFLLFWPFGPSSSFILAFWAFISYPFGLLRLHFLSFWPFGPSFPFILAFWVAFFISANRKFWKRKNCKISKEKCHFGPNPGRVAFWTFISFHFGLWGLHFLPFWFFSPSFPFILIFWALISFHFVFWAVISFHFGLLGLHFLSFWSFGASFPFILAFWAFISFHFGLLGSIFCFCKWQILAKEKLQNFKGKMPFWAKSWPDGLLGLHFLSFWSFPPLFLFILVFWAFISFHFGLLGLHFLSFWSFGFSFPFILAFWVAFFASANGKFWQRENCKI